ncbi:MAG TPA: M20/M25/M40 family metallo-hydrolase, partial [Xanthomonadales bacterium]|nr:M20/M25/M40 family metallo-hydrolase [Xanthomonadales bacterium]
MIRSILAATLALPAAFAAAQDAPHERQAREVYTRVVAMRTAAGHAQTAPMVAYLAGVLKDGGVPAGDIETLEAGGETAMLVRLPGSRGGTRPILFSAHMDVVDARPEEWARDPFTLVEENGNFYGRGTMDNKAGVVAMVATILRFKAERLAPARTLVFAFVGDEETQMLTTRAIAAHAWVKNAEFAINTDAGGGLLDEASGKPL